MADSFIPLKFKIDSGGNPTAWSEYQAGDTMQMPGNVQLVGTARRFLGDFSTSAVNNRTMMQSIVANGNTSVGMIPNGTSTIANLTLYNNSADQANSSVGRFGINSGAVSLESAVNGTGTALPISVSVSGTLRLSLNTDGTFQFPAAGQRITGDLSSGVGSLANRLCFQSSKVNGQTMVTAIPNGTSNIAGFQAWANGADMENSSRMVLFTDGTVATVAADRLGTGAYLPLTLNSGGAERMRFDTSGGWYLGSTSNDPVTNQVNGMYRGPAGSLAMYSNSGIITLRMGAASGSQTFVSFTSNGSTAVGSISTNGSFTAYNTSSDYRLKDDVQSLDPIEATERVMAYRPVTWTWKTDGSYGKGFIAHECQVVDPMTATGIKDEVEQIGNVVLADGTVAAIGVREPEDPSIYGEGATWEFTEERPVYQGRDDSKMIPDMIAMMQRMELRIRELEAQIELLKATTE